MFLNETKNNILEQAGTLFYSQGFNHTGMEKITIVCGIKKPTLYYYFPSKNALGIAYLESRASALFSMLNALLGRANSLDQYLSSWASALILMARRNEFFGCPFTSFASELNSEERTYFEKTLKNIEEDWLNIQVQAYQKFYSKSTVAKQFAEKILVTHTGCVMLYRASRDLNYLKQLKSGFADIAKAVKLASKNNSNG